MKRTTADLRASNVPSPILLEAAGKRCFVSDATDPVERRIARAEYLAKLRYLMPLGGKSIPEVEERDIYVTVRDNYEVRVRIYTPTEGRRLQGGGPLMLMFHEGGWTAGDLSDEELNCRLFAREFGAVCGNVEYRYVLYYPICCDEHRLHGIDRC